MAASRGRARGLARATEVGERVFLRRPSASDEDEYCALLLASSAFHRRWMPRPPPGVDPAGPAAFRRSLQLARRADGDRLLLCRREDGAILGGFNLNAIVRGPFQSAYLGYWIGAPFRQQGYMRDGLPLVLKRAFGTLALHRVEANIQPHNAPSLALVRGAGFRCEGLARRYLKIAGRWRDHEHWVMLAEDWRAAQKRTVSAVRGSKRR
jgi:[ribosomal protein S5]-alanine N-acetyltransferase